MAVQRTLRSQREAEDSHNYVDEESEAATVDEEPELYDYNFKDALLDFLCNKRVIFSLTSIIFFLGAAFTRGHEFSGVREDGGEYKFSTPRVLILAGAFILIGALLEYLIDYFSYVQLKKSRGSGAFWFYTNELSLYITLFSGLACACLYISFKYKRFYIDILSLKLDVQDPFRIFLITLLALASEKAIGKHISMGFNYNHYVNRIRKCLLFNFFMSLIENISEADSDVIIEVPGDDGPILFVDSRGTEVVSNTLVLQKKFRAKNLEKLNFGSKRVLIKEFIHQARGMVSHFGSLPLILGKIRSLASRKANKLVKKLVRRNKVTKMGDFSRYFGNSTTYEYLLKQLDIGEDELVERGNFMKIIERSYREQYVVYQSIEQVNSAINKVIFFIQLATIAGALLIIYTSGIGQNNQVLGALSAIFGTQFISKLIPDYMIKSIIFLFSIHPFDIGDRILVKLNNEEENLVAAELNVFSTLFYRWDGTSVFVPNYILADLPITNLQRSGSTMESHSIQINAGTDPVKLESLKQQLVDFCRAHSESYTDYVLVNYEKIENSHKLYIKVLMQYKTNKQNYESYLKRKTQFLMELNRLIEALGIRYDLPVQKVSIRRGDLELGSGVLDVRD